MLGLTKLHTFILDRIRQCADQEVEQSIIRLIISSILFIYLFTHISNPESTQTIVLLLKLSIGFTAFSALYLIAIILAPTTYTVRRYIGMFVDLSTTSLAMIIGGETVTPFYLIYLWVTLGNGFRYGLTPLYASTVTSLAGFTCVIIFSDFWSQHVILSLGLLLGLVIIPTYASTLLKRLNEALRKSNLASEAKSLFLANMSHEIRTPLNGVIGATDLLLETPLDEEQKDLALTANVSANSLLSLIQGILDIAKIESGEASVHTVDADLYILINSIIRMMQPVAKSHGLTLKADIHPEVPVYVRIDTQLLRQILINLLGNGIKFTEKGSVTLTISLDNRNIPNNWQTLLIEVTDTGIGISAEDQERIFDRFEQVDNSDTRNYGGTGLGIAISRQLVDLMGGSLKLDSEPGQGSRFYFDLPVVIQEREQKEINEMNIEQLNILLVSANDIDKERIQGYFKNWNCEISTESSLLRASASLVNSFNNNTPFNLIIIDEYNAIDPEHAAKLLLSENINGDLKLILITDEMDRKTRSSLLNTGYHAVLYRPINPTMLFHVLHNIDHSVIDEHPSVIPLHPFTTKNDNKPLHILLAEDNATNQKIVQKTVERHGHHIHIVSSGEQALDALGKHSYDIAIFDMQMPDMGGLDAIKLHRAISLDEDEMRIVVLTANATSQAAQACEDANVDAFLTKPIRPQELIDALYRVVGRKSRSDIFRDKSDLREKNIYIDPKSGRHILDRQVLMDLVQLDSDPAYLKDLIKGFIEDSDQILSTMLTAVHKRDNLLYRECAHALAGNAAGMGALMLQDTCARASGIDDLDFRRNCNELYDTTQHAYFLTKEAINAYMEQKLYETLH